MHKRVLAFDDHDSSMSELKRSHSGLSAKKAELENHHATLKERIDYLEGLMNDSTDKHAQKLQDAHSKVDDMHGRLSSLEKNSGAILELKRNHAELLSHKNSLSADHSGLKG